MILYLQLFVVVIYGFFLNIAKGLESGSDSEGVVRIKKRKVMSDSEGEEENSDSEAKPVIS